MNPWAAGEPVAWAARRLAECGVESSRMEAQLLLALALGITRTAVSAGLHAPLDGSAAGRFEELVEARCRRTPLAYLRGTQEFYGLEFEVDPSVLIPRPETEMLVDFAREKLNFTPPGGHGAPVQRTTYLADVGTGSGCIAISILTYCVHARGAAVELSPRALNVASRNARRHGVSARLRFIQGDLLSSASAGRFDLIVSNPPYIPSAEIRELQPEVRDAEPCLALDGGPDGLGPYRRLAPQSARCLAPGGWLAVEVGQGQAHEVADLFDGTGLREVDVREDLAGIERVVAARRHGG